MNILIFGYFSNIGDPVREHKSNLISQLVRPLEVLGHSISIMDYGNADVALKIDDCGYLNFRDYKTKCSDVLSLKFVIAIFRLGKMCFRLNRQISVFAPSGIRGRLRRYLVFIRSVITYQKILSDEAVDVVIVWNPHAGNHLLLKELCRIYDISFLGIEGGLVPGTVELDNGGHQADGAIQRNILKFQSLEVSEKEVELADDYLRYVKSNRISKKEQSKSGVSLASLKRAMPIVFLAGVDQRATGILSSYEGEKNLFSPFYLREKDLFKDLIDIARTEGYQVVYKPHPNSKFLPTEYLEFDFELEDHLVLRDADLFDLIDASDLMVTIGSTVSIHSILQDKPVVLAGVNAFRGTGICHDLVAQADLSTLLKKAFERHDFDKQKRRLVEFTARSMKYYSSPYSKYCEEFYGNAGEMLANRVKQILDVGREF